MHDGMQHHQVQRQGQRNEPWKSKIQPFSKAISFPIYNGGWQVITDS